MCNLHLLLTWFVLLYHPYYRRQSCDRHYVERAFSRSFLLLLLMVLLLDLICIYFGVVGILHLKLGDYVKNVTSN